MQPVSPPTDNILELLNMILQFTQSREQVLIDNIRHGEKPGFVPSDLDAETFSQIVDEALTEFLTHGRLVLRDTKNVQFVGEGTFRASPVADKEAIRLQTHKEKYFQYQALKLAQNSTNARVAERLIEKNASNQPVTISRSVSRDVA